MDAGVRHDAARPSWRAANPKPRWPPSNPTSPDSHATAVALSRSGCPGRQAVRSHLRATCESEPSSAHPGPFAAASKSIAVVGADDRFRSHDGCQPAIAHRRPGSRPLRHRADDAARCRPRRAANLAPDCDRCRPAWRVPPWLGHHSRRGFVPRYRQAGPRLRCWSGVGLSVSPSVCPTGADGSR